MSEARRPATRLEREDRIVTLTLDRPETLNAYDKTMRDEIFATLEWLHREPEVSVLVVRGEGRAFSTGGDLNEFGTAPSPVRAREVRQVRDVWRLWSTLPCVSLAAVHGYAVGGGLEMALLCDFLVCTTDARFALPETGLGLIPGVGGTQTLPRAIGLSRAASVLLAGEWIDGREAARIGLALEAVPPSRLLTTARRLARRLASADPRLLRAAKQCVRRGIDLPLADGLRLERRIGSAIGPREQ
ncbi:MAG TPA: enoyl-CoA hydratase/isomerase family protein [Candidatus Binatia bacterium]